MIVRKAGRAACFLLALSSPFAYNTKTYRQNYVRVRKFPLAGNWQTTLTRRSYPPARPFQTRISLTTEYATLRMVRIERRAT